MKRHVKNRYHRTIYTLFKEIFFIKMSITKLIFENAIGVFSVYTLWLYNFLNNLNFLKKNVNQLKKNKS